MSTDWCERRRVLDTGKTTYAHIHIYVKPGKQLIVYGKGSGEQGLRGDEMDQIIEEPRQSILRVSFLSFFFFKTMVSH